jgi:hypothetical protein
MMDQKEIDALINQGSVEDFNKQQAELLKNLVESPASTTGSNTQSATPDSENTEPPQSENGASPHKKGKVMGQLSRVTEEAEAGTNMVMGYLENVLTFVSRQQSFIDDIVNKYEESPTAINVSEALNFLKDNLVAIEEAIFNAMDAFQFQDIGRQKLMKVMYTLAKLNEYLNELLGGEAEAQKTFGHRIEKKTMEQDRDKTHVDGIVSSFQNSIENDASAQEVSAPTSDNDSNNTNPVDNDMSEMANETDVDSIIAAFKSQNNQNPENKKEPDSGSNSATLGNDDIDSLIAEFQNSQND